jgi:hypothetical protein
MADKPKPKPSTPNPAGLVPDNDTLSAEDEALLDAAWASVKKAAKTKPQQQEKAKGEE